MAFPTRSYDEIFRRVLGNFRTSFPGFPLGAKRFLGKAARAFGLIIWQQQKSAEDIARDIVPSSQSSADALSDWAALLGLANGAGGYGRRVATTASGGAATLTGVNGTIYPDGILATAEDGVTQIALSGAVTIPAGTGFGSIAAEFVSVTTGTSGNLPEGTVCTWESAPSGADAQFTLTAPLEGALDEEDNDSLYGRIVLALQAPKRGGVDSDYAFWVEQVTGVFRAHIFPKRSGTGTVDVIPVEAGTGQARVPSSAIITAAQAALDAARPAGADAATVIAPYMPNGSGHLVRLRCTPSATKYAFDWDDTSGGPFTVNLYTAGAPATLQLNTLAPATLKAAIDAYIAGNGLAPRLQVLSTGRVINDPVRAVAYVDGGGMTTLTLETLPDNWSAPTMGDTVYAYGPMVATIAAGALALADSLGPARVSDFGSTILPWQDTLTISGLIGVAEAAIDTDGTKLIGEVLVGGATIDGAVADVSPTDNTVNGPEILYLSHVAVTA